jgi:hypothetical protein
MDYRLHTLLGVGIGHIPQILGFGEGCIGLGSAAEQLESLAFVIPGYGMFRI